jgi:hypothetical protein
MTLPPDVAAQRPVAPVTLLLLERVLGPDTLLRLREEAVRHGQAHPQVVAWREALRAIDHALHELASTRARAGFVAPAVTAASSSAGVEHQVIDLRTGERGRLARTTE